MKEKIRIRTYTVNGDMDKEYYFNEMREALGKYLEAKNSLPSNYHRRVCGPTVWIYDGERYLRVHDFQFSQLTNETLAKYLKERILHTDYLLDAFCG